MDTPHNILLSGAPFDRGKTHGQRLGPVIRDLLNRWESRVEARIKRPVSHYRRFIFSSTGLPGAAKKWAPELIEEIHGIAEGAGLPFETLFCWQLFDEHGWLLKRFEATATISPEAHCTSIGIRGRGEHCAVMGQDLDIPSYKEGCQTLLRIRYKDFELLTATQAGAIASLGLSNLSLGVCVNYLEQLKPEGCGLPVAFIVRRLLEMETLDKAEAFLREITHATGQNYLVGQGNAVRCFECSGNTVVEYKPDSSILYHTNHALVSTDFADAKTATLPKTSSTFSRFDFLENQTKFLAQNPDGGWVKKLLSTSPVCIGAQPEALPFSAFCAIMTLSDKPVLELAAGPPDVTRFQTFGFEA